MCSIKKIGICAFCPHDDRCEEEREQFLSELCFRWWNFDEVPPEHLRTEEVLSAMMDYIHNHPEKFRGARPQ